MSLDVKLAPATNIVCYFGWSLAYYLEASVYYGSAEMWFATEVDRKRLEAFHYTFVREEL